MGITKKEVYTGIRNRIEFLGDSGNPRLCVNFPELKPT
jgi:hypothetical protein